MVKCLGKNIFLEFFISVTQKHVFELILQQFPAGVKFKKHCHESEGSFGHLGHINPGTGF